MDISLLRHISKQRGRQGGTTGAHRHRDTHYLADMQVMSGDVVQCSVERGFYTSGGQVSQYEMEKKCLKALFLSQASTTDWVLLRVFGGQITL